jgi:hypothetical protein
LNFANAALPAVILLVATSLILIASPDWRFSIASLAVQYVGVFVLVALSWPVEMAVVKLVAGWMAGAMLGMAIVSLPAGTANPPADTAVNPPVSTAVSTAGNPAGYAARNPAANHAANTGGPTRIPASRDASIFSRVTSRQSDPDSEFPHPAIPTSRPFRLLTAILAGLAVISAAPEIVEWLPGLRIEQAWGGLLLIGMGLIQLGFTIQPLRTSLALLTFLAGFEILYAAVETSTLVAGLLAGVNLMLALTGSYLLSAPHMESE